MIALENLAIGHGTHLLAHADRVVIPDGRLVALIGRNGTGKSTLLNTIAGLRRPKGGRVALGDDAADLARCVAYVSTERIRIANMSCHDVVALGRAPYTDWIGRLSVEDEHIVERALNSVGMGAYSHRTLDTMSDGECQRIMIARALAQTTPVILLDEPTSFLDMPGRYEVCSLLSALAHDEGKTILFSTHELDIALNICDDILLIDTPHIVYGTTAQIKASDALQRLFRTSGDAGVSFVPRCVG